MTLLLCCRGVTRVWKEQKSSGGRGGEARVEIRSEGGEAEAGEGAGAEAGTEMGGNRDGGKDRTTCRRGKQ